MVIVRKYTALIYTILTVFWYQIATKHSLCMLILSTQIGDSIKICEDNNMGKSQTVLVIDVTHMTIKLLSNTESANV